MLEYILNFFKKITEEPINILMHVSDDKLSSLDDLFKRSINYRDSKNYLEALNFIAKIRNVAPYNAWLLKEQNPDITYVATAYEWKKEFNRDVNAKARAYVILKAFGPVSFVYDVQDTVGEELPADIHSFFRADGILKKNMLKAILDCCMKKGIVVEYDTSLFERQAGWASHDKLNKTHSIVINANHAPEVQFSTLCHELAHLMLGHLGKFKNCQCKTPNKQLSEAVEEVEAESVSWLVSQRLNIQTNADTYLSSYFGSNDEQILQDISIDNILTTAGRIEAMIFNKTCYVKKEKKNG